MYLCERTCSWRTQSSAVCSLPGLDDRYAVGNDPRMTDLMLRPWASGDQLQVLLDADPDPLWVKQGHALHGADRVAPRWKRTVVATIGEELVGAVTVAVNQVHPGRFTCAIDVAQAHRRNRIGTRLLAEARGLRPDDRPLASKVRPSNPAATGLLRAGGGRTYQRCLGQVVDPSAAEVRSWCQKMGGDVTVTSLTDVAPATIAAAWAQLYCWQHADWSPVGDGAALTQYAADAAREADPQLSAAAWKGARMTALVTVFREPEQSVEIVAETVTAEEPDGMKHLAVALARSLTACAAVDVRRAEFDGHVTDPHLAEVLGGLPTIGGNPLDLVEVW